MRIDSQLAFIPVGAPLSLVGGAGVGIPSTNTIDLLGQGVGTAPQNIIGNAAVFGSDVGVGRYVPQLEVILGSTFTTATAATLTVQFQAAPDTGAAGGYQPGTWITLEETAAIPVADLVVPADLGSFSALDVIARFGFPPSYPTNLQPRYLRLNFAVPAGTDFTAGTIAAAIVTTVRDDTNFRNASANYIVA